MLIVKLQVLGLGLGVDFVFPLSQEQQQQQEPPPKFLERNNTRDKEQGVGIRKRVSPRPLVEFDSEDPNLVLDVLIQL